MSLNALSFSYDFDSSSEQTEAYYIFWHNDNIVEHVLVGKLSQEIQDSLSLKCGGLYNLSIYPAHALLAFFQEHFGIGSALIAELTKSKVFALLATQTSVSSCVQQWHSAIHQLSSISWDFTS